MYHRAQSTDDLLRKVYGDLLKVKSRVNPTKGENRERIGVILELSDPRSRLSRAETRDTLFSALGELLWYLSKSDDVEFIKYYIPSYGKYAEDNGKVHGAYGPRIFNMRGRNQIDSIISRLKEKPDTRRAVIQLFNAEDLEKDYYDIPCTCTMQFMVRRKFLHMFTSMRSNDAYKGLPHDIFTFTMLQELIAKSLDVRLGRYKHAAGSLHLYDTDLDRAKTYLQEGWQSIYSMPEMPKGDPWPSVERVLEAEANIRAGADVDLASLKLDEYWKDIVRLLQIFAASKSQDSRRVKRLEAKMHSPLYDTYIAKRRTAPSIKPSEQLPLLNPPDKQELETES